MAEIALFNLDHTITDFHIQNCMADLVNAGIAGAELLEDTRRLSLFDQRKRLVGWCASHTAVEVEPLIDITTERAAQRVTSWATILMKAHQQAGHVLGLYSTQTPKAIVEAYANGLEEVTPDLTIEHVFGADIEQYENGSGDGLKMMRREQIMEWVEEAGHKLLFVADSFHTAAPLFRNADRFLYVNPDRAIPRDESYQDADKLFWHHPKLAVANFVSPRLAEEHSYDLDIGDDIERFLEDTEHLYDSRSD